MEFFRGNRHIWGKFLRGEEYIFSQCIFDGFLQGYESDFKMQ